MSYSHFLGQLFYKTLIQYVLYSGNRAYSRSNTGLTHFNAAATIL